MRNREELQKDFDTYTGSRDDLLMEVFLDMRDTLNIISQGIKSIEKKLSKTYRQV